MRAKFGMYRSAKSGYWYWQDNESRKLGQVVQGTLGTKDKAEATRLLHAKNESQVMPAINMQIARAYLQASDPDVANRNWQFVMDEIVKTKKGPTQHRWKIAIKDRNFDLIRKVPVLQSRAEHFLAVLNKGTVSTNVYLRRIHNFALDMNWLPWPVIPKRQWPGVEYQTKRAITWEEHQEIIKREQNLERKSFYELCWHLGGAQGDLAKLHAEDIDWAGQVISYFRQKTKEVAQIHFGDAVKAILLELPKKGALFPYLETVRASDRATEFKQRCDGLQIKGVTLHSYRYAWAERAKTAGYPERFAQAALGHNSKAVHRYYARNALVKIPSLEQYEQEQKAKAVVAVDFTKLAVGQKG
ncbi:MAG: tyrosine-type recombinase/integrase [Verrucomicrobiales bacterium]